MSHAGYNATANIWRYVYYPDDTVGGSQPSGSIIYNNVPCRIEPIPAVMALLQQGIEHLEMYHVALSYNGVGVLYNDTFQVIEPHESWYYTGSFRIIDVEHPSMHPSDPRGYLILTIRRNQEAHAVQS